MVNTGRPSMGCMRCRKLKTRCCESRPNCSRCSKRGVSCVWPSPSRFKSMNSWSEKTVQTRVARKLESYVVSDLIHCNEQIPLNWFEESLGPFFDNFTAGPDILNSQWGFLPDLPSFYSQADPSSHLAQAVKACALSSLANHSNIASLRLAAFRCYGSSLRSLCVAMDQPQKAATEGALSTMMLLSLFESISGTKPPKELFQAHYRGQARMIRLKDSSSDLSIVAHSNRHALCKDLAERRPVTFGLMDWPSSTYRSWLDEGVARLQVQIVNVCAQVIELQERDTEDRNEVWMEEVLDVAKTLERVEGAVSRLHRDAPAEWQPRAMNLGWRAAPAILEGFPTYGLSNRCAHFSEMAPARTIPPPLEHALRETTWAVYEPKIDVYATRAVANLWNWLRASQLHLYRSMIDMAHLLGECQVRSPKFDLGELLCRISDTIHDICGSIAYILGDVEVDSDGDLVYNAPSPRNVGSGHGLGVLWYLHKVCAVPGINSSVRTFILGVFDRIGTVGHIRQGSMLKQFYLHK